MLQKIQNLIPKLLYFFLITTVIVTTFSLSKYESAIAGSNNAVVAAFVIKANGDETDALAVDCNEPFPTADYNIKVTNKVDDVVSQVGIKYNLVATLSEALPEGMQISVTTGDITLIQNGGTDTYTFENVGNFEADVESITTHTVSFVGSENVTAAFQGTVTFYIDATQID